MNFLLTDTHSLSHSLPSFRQVYNLIKLMGLIFAVFYHCFFPSHACIMVLPELTFVLHFFLHCHIGDNLWYMHQKSVWLWCETRAKCSASRGAYYIILCLEYCLKCPRPGVKQSIVIHCDQATHSLKINN